jgi:hypothetical protein
MTTDPPFRRQKPAASGALQTRGGAVLQALLTELAFVLLPRGMTPRLFSTLARSAFVEAAADISKLRNGKVNYSRVAAQTGLTRADVKRLLSENIFNSVRRGGTAIERVIHGWRTDREFVTGAGYPRRLKISGARRSFAGLVRKYGGDVPHRAVLDELRRIEVVSDYDGAVKLRGSSQLRGRYNFAFLAPILPALVDGLRIVSDNAPSNPLSSIQRLILPVETEVDLAIVRNRCTSSVRSMLEGLSDSLGTQVTLPRKRKSSASYSFAITILLSESRSKRTFRSAVSEKGPT